MATPGNYVPPSGEATGYYVKPSGAVTPFDPNKSFGANAAGPVMNNPFAGGSGQSGLSAPYSGDPNAQQAFDLSGLGLTAAGSTQTAQNGLPGALGFQTTQNLYGNAIQNPFDLSGFQKQIALQKRNLQDFSPAAQMSAAQATGPNDTNVNRLTGSLFGQAEGTSGPTAADLEFQRASNQNMQDAMSMAASAPAHGGSYTAALRSAMRQNALSGQNAALAAGQLRAQEQQAAYGQLGNLLPGIRGQDIGLSTSNAQLQQGAGELNAQLQQQNTFDIRTRMQQLMAMNMTAEQAYNQSLIEQRQANLDTIVRQLGVAKGLSLDSGKSGLNAAAAGASALGTLATL